MARPLTGQREMFRRLQENNEAKKERVNQVRELGGLEPLEEPQLNQFFDYIEHYLEQPMPYYQRQIVERATDHPMVIVGGGRPNRNHTAYTQEMLQKMAGQLGTVTIDTEMPRVRTTAPTMSWHYIEDAITHLNPCSEIFQDNEMNWRYPGSDEDKIALRKRANMKLESNEDFAFLLNNEE